MGDELKILITAGLNSDKSKDNISNDLKTVANSINAEKPTPLQIVGSLKFEDTKKQIQTQFTNISKMLKLNVGVSSESIKQSISQISKATANTTTKNNLSLQLFNTTDLKKEGRKYFSKTTDIINRVKDYYAKNGAVKVDLSSFEKSNGQIKSFTATVEDATGIIKKYNYERALLNSNKNYGFVQSDSLTSIDKNAGANLKSTLNYLNGIDNKIATIKNNATNMTKPLQEDTVYYDNYNKKLTETVTKIEDIRNSNKVLSDEQKRNINSMIVSLQNYTKSQQQAAYVPLIDNTALSDTITKKTASLTTLEQKWKTQGILTGEFQTKVEALKTALSQVGDTKGLNNYTTQLKVVDEEAKRLYKDIQSNNAFAKQAEDSEKLELRTKNLIAQIKAYQQLNQKAMKSQSKTSVGLTYKQELDGFIATLNKAGGVSKDELQKIATGFRTIKTEITAANIQGNTFFGNLKEKAQKFAGWMGLTTIISGAVRSVKQMVSNVIELDSAMVNLKKVTDETDSTYSKFLKDAHKQAQELHSTVTDLVEQTAMWSKLGYKLSQSQDLAKTSMIYSKVGEVDNQTAVSDLVTSMKAFDIEANNSIRIVDSLNQIGNTFATDAASLGEGLTKSASALNAANNSFEQSIALLTGGTEITQNANEMGSALKVISMRIRGMKGELEDLGEEYDNIESISKIQTQILNLSNGKVNIFDNNGDFRSTYDILKDISKIYNELNDPSKANLTEILFGKMRGNQGIAILQAFQSGQIEKAYETALNSAGSAQKEYDRYSKSIEASINTFKAAFETLSNTVIDSDLIKGVVDFSTTVINTIDTIINKIGMLPPILTGVFVGITKLSGTGIFKVFTDGFKIDNITFFGKQIAGVKKTIEDIDYSGLQKFNAELLNGVNKTDAFEKTLKGCSSETKEVSKTLENLNDQRKAGTITEALYTAEVKKLTTAQTKLTFAQKASAVASKAMGVALNMALNAGFALAITGIITLISKAINKQKELTETANENAQAFKDQKQEIDDIKKQYLEIVDSQKSEIEKTKELNDFKSTLIDTYGFEKQALQDLNLEREKGTELIEKEAQANLGSYIADKENQKAYEEARKKLVANNPNQSTGSVSLSEDGQIRDSIKEMFPYLSKGYMQTAQGMEYSGYFNYDLGTDNLMEQYDVLTQIISSMGVITNLSDDEEKLLNHLSSSQKDISKDIEKYRDSFETYLTALGDRNLDEYIKIDGNELENVGADNYYKWREGLLTTAEGDTELEKELSNQLLKLFPDLEEPIKKQQEQMRKNTFAIQGMTDAEKSYYYAQEYIKNEIQESIEKQSKDSSAIQDTTDTLEDLATSIENTSKKTKTLKTAMEEMNDTGYLSSSTYAEIVELGGNFAECLEVQNGKLILNVQKLKDLETQEYKNKIALNELSIAELNYARARTTAWGGDTSTIDEQLSKLREESAIYSTLIDEINNTDISENSSSGSKTDPKSVTDFETAYADKQHEINMGRMKEDEAYYNWLETAANTAYAGLEDYQDDLYKYEEEVYKGRKQLQQDLFDQEHDLFEQRLDDLDKIAEKVNETSTDTDGTKLNRNEKWSAIRSAYQEAQYAIDDEINRVVHAGVDGNEDLLKELNEQWDEYAEKIADTFTSLNEEEQDYIKEQKDYYSEIMDEKIKAIETERDANEEVRQAEINAIQDKIDLLEKANDEKEKEINLEKLKQNLEKAKNQKTVGVMSEDGVINYVADQDAVNEAQKALDEAVYDDQIRLLEDQKATLEDIRDKETEGYDIIVEQLQTDQMATEEHYDILAGIIETYLNPDKQSVITDKAKESGISFKDGLWTDKNGKPIDISEFVSSALTVDTEKLTQNVENTSNETPQKWDFKTAMAEKFGVDASTFDLTNILKAIGNINVPTVETLGSNISSATSYINTANNVNNNMSYSINGDIVISNPVGNADDLASAIVKNFGTAMDKQINKAR